MVEDTSRDFPIPTSSSAPRRKMTRERGDERLKRPRPSEDLSNLSPEQPRGPIRHPRESRPEIDPVTSQPLLVRRERGGTRTQHSSSPPRRPAHSPPSPKGPYKRSLPRKLGSGSSRNLDCSLLRKQEGSGMQLEEERRRWAEGGRGGRGSRGLRLGVEERRGRASWSA